MGFCRSLWSYARTCLRMTLLAVNGRPPIDSNASSVFAAEACERRVMLAGITIVTHGYQGDLVDSEFLPTWTLFMADAIADRAPGGGQVGHYDKSTGRYQRVTFYDGDTSYNI